eukprot:CAMPEP_0182516046 /NCGR_PEP_ID=MMETSP1321-20130603/39466_1 /TAXON_ID=91990 /ORGANISM="Bolidomonas sp., Strain RCC1657" /LENGTH=64 /DNA_ID=CAMNT_0024723567 /DNA_START=21 /DNA_END=212 /DNA_ORIENTATION=+
MKKRVARSFKTFCTVASTGMTSSLEFSDCCLSSLMSLANLTNLTMRIIFRPLSPVDEGKSDTIK